MAEVNWYEFEQQIAECEANGGTELDLGEFTCDCDGDVGCFDEGLRLVAQRLPRLEHLSLYLGEPENVESLARLAEELPSLQSLDLEVMGCGFETLAAKPKLLPLVRQLDGFEDDGLKAIAAVAEQLIGLRSIGFDGHEFSDEGLRALAAQAKHLVSLERLTDTEPPYFDTERERPATKKGYAALMAGLAAGRKKLDLSDWYVDDSGLKAFARQGPALASLVELDVSRGDSSFSPDEIGDEGVKALMRQARHLGNLQQLFLARTAVGDEGVKALANALQAGHLTNLSSLNLRGCVVSDEGVNALMAQAQHLGKLELLFLGHTQVSDNAVSALVEQAEHLNNLWALDLRGTSVSDKGLKELALARQIGKFSDLMKLNVEETQVKSVSSEVLLTEEAEQIFQAVLDGLALPEAKLVVLGEPGVGKTSLCRRLFRGRPADPSRRRETHDFELIRPKWRPLVRDLEVGLRVWDFGGQHVLHGTHEMFLTSRSVCLLVLDATQVEEHDPQVQDEERDGNRLSYWLKMIRHFVGKDAHVILVVTRCDESEPVLGSLDADRLRIDYGFTAPIELVEGFSATDKQRTQPVEELRKTITDVLGRMDELHSRVTREFVALKERMEREIAGRALVSLNEYRDWCRDVGVKKSYDQDVHLRTLHHFGSVFYFGRLDFERKQVQQRSLRNRLETDDLPLGQRRLLKAEPDSALRQWLINPHWLKRPLYRLIRESRGQPWLDEETIRKTARRKTAKLTIDDPDAAEDVVLAALKLTKLCFYDSERGKYFFPRGLPPDSGRFLTGWDASSRHEITWKWDFFPEAVIHRFIVKAHKHGEVLDEAQWRTGVVLRRGETTVAVQSEPEHGHVTVWLKKRDDNVAGQTRQDEKFVDELKRRLVELIHDEPNEETRSWEESEACAMDVAAVEESSPQQEPQSPDTAPGSFASPQEQPPAYSEKAYRAYEMAAEALGNPTDKQAYDWLEENPPDHYQPPDEETWYKYLRIARKHYGTSKKNPRAGRSTGRSIVRHDEI